MEMIRFDNVSKEYSHNITALKDVSFVVNKGELVFLTGPSGAGKTTILRLVFYAEPATAGEIYVAEEEITHLSRKQIPYLRRHIGVVFQDFRLLTDRTISENLDLILLVLGLASSERKRRCLQVLSQVGLAHRRNAFPHQLSGGEQQRIAIARAIITDPLILLADEPTGNLDPDTSWDIMQTLRQINARGTTVLVATHNYDIVRRVHAKLLHIRKGKLLAPQEYPEILRRETKGKERKIPESADSSRQSESILSRDYFAELIGTEEDFQVPPPPPDAE